jgi:DnaJ family protein A protein 2
MSTMFGQHARMICPDCNGSGKHIAPKDRCKKCKGQKVVEEKKPLNFWVERGMDDGHNIVLKGEADQEPGKETGDVVFIVDETPHPVFMRLGNDLKATLKVSLAEALCGFSRVILTTLDGRGLSYSHKVEEKGIIRPKDVFRIVGEGMPVGKKSDEKGDLYLDVEIEFPADVWISDPTKLDLLRSVFASSSSRMPLGQETNRTPTVVDDVELEKTDVDEFGGNVAGWETESNAESEGVPEQCPVQ